MADIDGHITEQQNVERGGLPADVLPAPVQLVLLPLQQGYGCIVLTVCCLQGIAVTQPVWPWPVIPGAVVELLLEHPEKRVVVQPELLLMAEVSKVFILYIQRRVVGQQRRIHGEGRGALVG